MVLKSKNVNRRTSNSQNTQPNASTVSRSLANRLRGRQEIYRRSRRTSGRHRPSESTIAASPMRKQKERAPKEEEEEESKPISVDLPRPPTSAPDVQMGGSTTPNPKTVTIRIPRRLARPVLPPIDRQKIVEIDESLADVPLRFIRIHLTVMVPEFALSIQSVTIPRIRPLPKEIDIAVNRRTTIYPTHVLAVTNSHRPETAGRLCLYPIHSIVFAAHCITMPSLPPVIPVPSGDAPATIRVPVYVIEIPHPETFGALYIFLYVRNAIRLTTDLIPMQPPPTLFQDRRQILEYAKRLARTFTRYAILDIIYKVHGCWRNLCGFGVDYKFMWDTMDILWAVVLTALSISAGPPHIITSGATSSQSQPAGSSSSRPVS